MEEKENLKEEKKVQQLLKKKSNQKKQKLDALNQLFIESNLPWRIENIKTLNIILHFCKQLDVSVLSSLSGNNSMSLIIAEKDIFCFQFLSILAGCATETCQFLYNPNLIQILRLSPMPFHEICIILRRLQFKLVQCSTWEYDQALKHELIKKVKTGSFGHISLIRLFTKKSTQKVICKQARKPLFSDMSFIREIAVLQKLFHVQGVVKLISLNLNKSLIWQLYLTSGAYSFEHVVTYESYTLKHVYFWMWRLCECLANVHELRVVHRDLKPSNIVLMDNLVDVMIIDWGGAILNNTHDVDWYSTTASYRSPEVWALKQDEFPLQAIDMWSLALIWCDLVNHKCYSAFSFDSEDTHLYFEAEYIRRRRELSDLLWNDSLVDRRMFYAMTHPDPFKRTSARQAAIHFRLQAESCEVVNRRNLTPSSPASSAVLVAVVTTATTTTVTATTNTTATTTLEEEKKQQSKGKTFTKHQYSEVCEQACEPQVNETQKINKHSTVLQSNITASHCFCCNIL